MSLGGQPAERIDPAQASQAAQAYLAAQEAVFACAEVRLSSDEQRSRRSLAVKRIKELSRQLRGKGNQFKMEVGKIAVASGKPLASVESISTAYSRDPAFAKIYDSFIETIGGK